MAGVMVCVQVKAGAGTWGVAGDSLCRKDTFYAFTGCLHNMERAGVPNAWGRRQNLCFCASLSLVS